MGGCGVYCTAEAGEEGTGLLFWLDCLAAVGVAVHMSMCAALADAGEVAAFAQVGAQAVAGLAIQCASEAGCGLGGWRKAFEHRCFRRSGDKTLGRSGVKTLGRSGVKTLGRSGVKTLGRSGVKTLGRSGVKTLGRSGVKTLGRSGVKTLVV